MRHKAQDALVASEHSVRLDPSYSSARDARTRIFLALGDPARAAREIDALERIDPGSGLVEELRARQAIAAGDPARARGYLAGLQRRAAAGETLGYVIATLQARLGDVDDAADTLERAFDARDPFVPADIEFILPEDWPDHPRIRAVFARPEVAAMVAERRRTRGAAAP
jgi:tetratricopeptide (TPR) repeat protein